MMRSPSHPCKMKASSVFIPLVQSLFCREYFQGNVESKMYSGNISVTLLTNVYLLSFWKFNLAPLTKRICVSYKRILEA